MSVVPIRSTLVFALPLLLLAAVPATAVDVSGPGVAFRLGPLPPDEPSSVTGGDGARFSARLAERATTSLMVPFFKVDRARGAGESTLYAIRNTSATTTHSVRVSYWVDHRFDPAADPDRVQTFQLGPRQVQTVNLRDVPQLDGGAGGDAMVRGWLVAEQTTGSNPALSGDWFRVTPGQDFATGGRMLDASASPYTCTKWDQRFLVGGAFSGGTRLEVFVDTPLGSHPGTDSPSLVITFTNEAGTVQGSAVEVFTDRQVMELDVATLRAMLPAPRPAYGALEIVFQPGSGGGVVSGSYRAEGRYSVEVDGTCLVR